MANLTFQKLMSILLILAVAFIMLVFITKPFAETLFKATDRNVEDCRMDIKAMSASNTGVLGYLSDNELAFTCNTKWVGNLSIKETGSKKQKKEALDQVMPLIGDCWYQFEEGQAQPYSKSAIDGDRYCFICSSFSLPKNFTTSLTNQDIKDYMSVNEYKRTDIIYAEYLKDAFFYDLTFVKEIKFKTNLQQTALLTTTFAGIPGFIIGVHAKTMDVEHEGGIFYRPTSTKNENMHDVVMYSIQTKEGVQWSSEFMNKIVLIRHDKFLDMDCKSLVKKDPNTIIE